MVLPDRIELSTSPLPMECSTTELRQHARYLRGIGPNGRPLGGRFLPQGPLRRKHAGRPERAQNRQKMALVADKLLQSGQPPRKLPRNSQGRAGSQPSVAGVRRRRIMTSHGLAAAVAIAARGGETHYVRMAALRAAGGRFDQGIFGGRTMKDDQDRPAGKSDADVKDSRRDRLKLALRENLKRRKSQARGRSDAGASSENADASLDDASGEKP